MLFILRTFVLPADEEDQVGLQLLLQLLHTPPPSQSYIFQVHRLHVLLGPGLPGSPQSANHPLQLLDLLVDGLIGAINCL